MDRKADELNVSAAGKNYGWPRITHGRNYGLGTKIGDGTEAPDVEPPLTVWIPSIAPSGMAFLTSDRYPGWRATCSSARCAARIWCASSSTAARSSSAIRC